MKSVLFRHGSEMDDLLAEPGVPRLRATLTTAVSASSVSKIELTTSLSSLSDNARIAFAEHPARPVQKEMRDREPCLLVGAQYLLPMLGLSSEPAKCARPTRCSAARSSASANFVGRMRIG